MSALHRGTLLAVLSALAFGASVPLVAIFGSDAGPWTTAALLYAGAALVGFASSRSARHEAPPTGLALARIAIAGLLGAALAPALLAWGLQHASALDGSLALSFEGAATVAIAIVSLREHVSGRAIVAVLATTFGAVLLAFGDSTGVLSVSGGTIAVLLATLLWAIDSTITGSLARFDPGSVTFWKSAFGAAVSFVIALLLRERYPSSVHLFALVATGAIGYGVSLRSYLAAQRAFGTARTASIFSLAPFAGAVVAIAAGDRPTLVIALAAAVLLLAVYLHATERHGHEHVHPPQRHEHAHLHDDDHHDHAHAGHGEHAPHSHDHPHDPRTHAHAHGSDFHHSHDHE